MDNLDIEAASWSLDTMLFGHRSSDSFEQKELALHISGLRRWEKLKAVPLDKILELGETYHIKTNGCGPQSWQINIVPNKPIWLGSVDFEPSGNAHDILFAIGGDRVDFVMANLYFHYQMRNACREAFPWSWRVGLRYGRVTSRIYYEAVDEFGWTHFTKR